jgi:G:T/U-mismatch repair DNA glycosylase
MAQLFDIEWSDDYTSKIQQVKCFPVILWDTLKACHREGSLDSAPVILWDTLKACHREGSLDSAITKDQLQANDIVGLLEQVIKTYLD